MILKITDLRERKGDSDRERGRIFEDRERERGLLSLKIADLSANTKRFQQTY